MNLFVFNSNLGFVCMFCVVTIIGCCSFVGFAVVVCLFVLVLPDCVVLWLDVLVCCLRLLCLLEFIVYFRVLILICWMSLLRCFLLVGWYWCDCFSFSFLVVVLWFVLR